MSARQLALDAGASGTYVAQIIRGDIGERIAYDRFVALAKAGGVSLHWLQTGEGDPEPPTPTTTEPVHDEELSELDRALLPFRAQLTPELEAHIRRRHREGVSFLAGGTMGELVGWVEREIAKWKREQDGMPPKITPAPDADADMGELMPLKPRPGKKPKGRG